MKYSLIALACVLAVATAQFNDGRYVPENQLNNRYNRYNQYNNRYNQYNPYNRYQQNQYNPFRPFASSTIAPRPSLFFSTTPVPSTVAPARVSFFSTAKPAAPAPSVAAPVVSVAPSAVPAPSAAPAPSEAPAPSAAPSAAPALSAAPAPSAAPVPVKPVVSYVSPVPVRYVGDGRNAEIVRFGNEINPDGAYEYFYETSNGIAAQEQGVQTTYLDGDRQEASNLVQGSYSYTSPEGLVIVRTYTADAGGFHPSGDDIPQPPEIPAQIARALEYIARTVPISAVPAK